MKSNDTDTTCTIINIYLKENPVGERPCINPEASQLQHFLCIFAVLVWQSHKNGLQYGLQAVTLVATRPSGNTFIIERAEDLNK